MDLHNLDDILALNVILLKIAKRNNTQLAMELFEYILQYVMCSESLTKHKNEICLFNANLMLVYDCEIHLVGTQVKILPDDFHENVRIGELIPKLLEVKWEL
jgi:hypothetical protein